jgi:hypothetical protein
MELTLRELVTTVHGMLFGGFFLMAIFGAIVLLVEEGHTPSGSHRPWQTAYLITMTVLGWLAVLSGAYIVYPWYRALAPAGADLAFYPQRLLLFHPSTAQWHYLGMEWKEHVAWFAPIACTAAAFIFLRHRPAWECDPQIRRSVLGFAAVAFLAAMLAGGWGAMIDKAAPIEGGQTIHLMRISH